MNPRCFGSAADAQEITATRRADAEKGYERIGRQVMGSEAGEGWVCTVSFVQCVCVSFFVVSSVLCVNVVCQSKLETKENCTSRDTEYWQFVYCGSLL